MKKMYDISWPISEATTGYKDKKVIQFEEVKRFAQDGARETIIQLSSHSGTHVDAPSHFLDDGKPIDETNLYQLVGECVVVDLREVLEQITYEDFARTGVVKENDIVLLKTINSDSQPTDKFSSQFVYLGVSGALYLKEKKAKAVGIDYLGIEHSQSDHVTHTTLMKNNIVIIEGLRLGPIKPGRYFLVCLPLYIIGLEAAPARAILIEQ